MRNIYKIELMLAVIGIFAIGLSLMPPATLTGYVSGLNITIYLQELNLTIDNSNSYTLASEKNLHLNSFMLSGEVFGSGRVEILLDNGKGQQYLVYENVIRKQELKTPNLITGIGITGRAIEENASLNEKKGTFLIVQPKKPIKYEFFRLNEGDEVMSGDFHAECIETCEIPKELFNSSSYELIFRLEQGTSVRIDEIRYALYK